MASSLKGPNTQVSDFTLQRRTQALSRLYKLAFVSIGVSCVSMVLGIVILVLSSGADFPVISGAPLWAGAVFSVTGVLGILASKEDVRYGFIPPPRTRCLLISHYTLCITCFSVCGICFGYSIGSVTMCSSSKENCGTNADQQIILNFIAIFIAFFMVICVFLGSIFFCVYKKTFGLYSPREMLFQSRIADLEDRIRTMENQNYQQQTQDGFGGQYSYNSFSTPTAPPPAYSK
ncbi:uncharacterized protein LOC133185091 [Saccostrea echinata]|uniref:uncharacterized protein LOC133185091 n=1 Tax=Saccostrea echinata TaxID=191078 RepID=UPI002A7FB049|nr:uncharacterized protein LOC133185091 [Saccostrea echinata]